MLKIFFLFTMFLISFSVCANIQDSKQYFQLFNQGTELLKSGNYKKSIEIFDALRQAGFKYPEVYNNLGIAHYKSGNLTLAISNYQRGLFLAPFDEALISNMNIALKKTSSIVTEKPYNIKLLLDRALLTATMILLITSIFFLFSSAQLVPISYRFPISYQKTTLITCTIICIILSIIMIRFNRSNYAIIIENNVVARIGPSMLANKSFDLQGGAKVITLESFKNWQKVQLADGNKGWILNKVIHKIQE